MTSQYCHHALVAMSLAVIGACGAPSTEELWSDARAAIAAGEVRTAEIHLKNLLQREPANAQARLVLGRVLLDRGHFTSAEQSLKRAVELGADPVEVQLPLLRALMAQDKFEAALIQIDRGPALPGKEQIELLSMQGAARRALGSLDLAEAAYRAALELDSSSADIRSALAAVCLASGRSDEAGELVAAVLRDAPDFPAALLVRGNLELSQARYDDAKLSFERVVFLGPGNDRRSEREHLVALAQLTETHLLLSNPEQAAVSADSLLSLSPQSPIARHLKARVEMENGDLDAAERLLETLISEVPQYWPAYRQLGAINFRQNQTGQAAMYLRTAVANDPGDNASRLLLAEIYVREDNLEPAKELFEEATDAGATDGLFLAFVGHKNLEAGRPTRASGYFDQSEQRAPADAGDLVGVASIYIAAGEFERAIRVLEATSFEEPESERLREYFLALSQLRQGDLDAADATAIRLAGRQPEAAWPLNLRGTIALLRRDFEVARDLHSAALDRDPQNVSALLNLARVAVAESDESQAEKYLRRVSEIDAREPTAPLGLAQLAASRGDIDVGLTWLERAPESAVRYRLEGQLRASRGEFDAAAAAFSRAFDLQPSAEVAMSVYAAASRAARQQPDAELTEWLSDHPDDIDVNFALGSIALGDRQNERAMEHYQAILDVDPKHVPALNNLAWIYGERGDERAIDLAARAYNIQPDNPAVADTLGWLYVRHGNADQALPLLDQAQVALPEEPEVRYHWAVALAETGDRERAASVLEALLSENHNFPAGRDAQARLDDLRSAKQD